MTHSIQNTVQRIVLATFSLMALLLGGLNSAAAVDLSASVLETNVQIATVANESDRSSLSVTTNHDDRGMRLAREDVALIRTAVVPGGGISNPGYNVPGTSMPNWEMQNNNPWDNSPNFNGLNFNGGPGNGRPGFRNPQQGRPEDWNNRGPGLNNNPSQWNTPGYNTPVIPNNPQPTAPNNSKPIDPQVEITSRFSDSAMLGFLSSTSLQQITSLYHEVSQMVDSRHVNPVSYEDRVTAAINNLVAAINNPTFLRASGSNASADAIRQTQGELLQTVYSLPARNATEAVGVMQWSAELVNRRLGIRREAVALEFLNGTIDALDQYSAFMPQAGGYSPGAGLEPVRTASLEERIVGVGVELETHPRGAILTGIVDNSPASELGLQEGDIIVAVNRQSVSGLDLNAVASRLGGSVGTVITVDIDRNGQFFRGNLTRRSIYVSSVTGTSMIDPQNKVGYIRLKQFSASSRKDLEAAMWKLQNQGMQSLVLDLRGNPGGLLDQAIEVSNLFVPYGTIVSTKGRNASDNSQEMATFDKTWNTPLVVLIDNNSASASEILAAAIQENGRGVIVGRQSYGKGTVQTHFPLKTVSGQLKLTTAKFYSPTGREMAGAGVTPDVFVQETQLNGVRGTTRDADVAMAIAQINQGWPAQLAQQAASGSQNGNVTPVRANPFPATSPVSVPNWNPQNWNNHSSNGYGYDLSSN